MNATQRFEFYLIVIDMIVFLSMICVWLSMGFQRMGKKTNKRRNSPTPGLAAHMRWFNEQSNFVRNQLDPKP